MRQLLPDGCAGLRTKWQSDMRQQLFHNTSLDGHNPTAETVIGACLHTGDLQSAVSMLSSHHPLHSSQDLASVGLSGRSWLFTIDGKAENIHSAVCAVQAMSSCATVCCSGCRARWPNMLFLMMWRLSRRFRTMVGCCCLGRYV